MMPECWWETEKERKSEERSRMKRNREEDQKYDSTSI